MMTVQQAFDLALQHHQMGRLAEAETLYRQILAVQPHHADTLHLLGVIAHQMGRNEVAVQMITQALAVNPNHPVAYTNLGCALRSQGRIEEAIAAFSQARQRAPHLAQTHENLANTLQGCGRNEEAVAAYLGLLQCSPGYAEGYYSLGIVYARLGRHDRAIAAYESALRLEPDSPAMLNNLGVALRERGHMSRAIESFRRALQLEPKMPEAHCNLGNALKDIGQFDEARREFERAIELKSDYADACNGLASILKDQACVEEALAQFRRAVELAPNDASLHSNLICMLHFDPSQGADAIAAEQQRWDEKFCAPLRGDLPRHANDRSPERRLRLGYVSADFRGHVIGWNLLPLFKAHDHREFEVFCYSDVVREDEWTGQFRQHADHWRETVGIPTQKLSEMIQGDGIDILVDLAQHLAGNRLPVFARQPAPVQVSFAGYPESTGLETIAYRISDRYLEAGERAGSERYVSLDSFWCYEPSVPGLTSNEAPAESNGFITFGSLNNFCKINPLVVRLWARVLAAVEGSKLLLLSAPGDHRGRMVEAFAREGIAAGRVDFVEPRLRHEYLEIYHRLDIVLDPFPYNGHTTSLDALWMGVPVVSLAGEQAVSRAGLSQLTNLGLPDLVAFTEDDYVQIATRLAGDLVRLRELRRTLRSRMENSVLMNAPHFAQQIESAYRSMWHRWCAREIKQ